MVKDQCKALETNPSSEKNKSDQINIRDQNNQNQKQSKIRAISNELVDTIFTNDIDMENDQNYKDALILISKMNEFEIEMINKDQQKLQQVEEIDKTTNQELNAELKELKKSLHSKTKSIKELEAQFEKLIRGNDDNEEILKKKQIDARSRKSEMFEKTNWHINDLIIVLSKLSAIYKSEDKNLLKETLFEQMEQIKEEFQPLLQLTESHLHATEFIDDITQEKQDLYLSLIKCKEIHAERKQEYDDSLDMKKELESQYEESNQINEELKKQQIEDVSKNLYGENNSILSDLTIKKLELEQENAEKSAFNKIYTMTISDILQNENENNKESAEKLKEYIQLLIEREENRKSQKKDYSNEILSYESPSLIFEKESLPIKVSGSSLESLAAILLKSSNEDPLFIKALCILLLNINADLSQFFELIEKKYDLTSRNKAFKNQRISSFMWQYKEYQDINFETITKRFAYLERPKFNPHFLHINYVDAKMHQSSKEFIFSADPNVLAEHLSAYELTMIRQIPITELKAAEWISKSKNEKAPFIMRLVNHFNRIGEYLITSFFQKETKEERVNLLKQWLQLYFAAEKINNFTLIFALSGTFNHKLLGHVEEWQEIPESMMDDYKRIDAYCSPLKKFKNYNTRLSQLQEEYVIPYIGTNLTNIVFINDGNPLMIKSPETGEELYNFKKQRAIAEQITIIKKHWGRKLHFTISKELYDRIDEELRTTHYTDDDIMRMYEKCYNVEKSISL